MKEVQVIRLFGIGTLVWGVLSAVLSIASDESPAVFAFVLIVVGAQVAAFPHGFTSQRQRTAAAEASMRARIRRASLGLPPLASGALVGVVLFCALLWLGHFLNLEG